jgi:MYXO-CTERM domain-containing protein
MDCKTFPNLKCDTSQSPHQCVPCLSNGDCPAGSMCTAAHTCTTPSGGDSGPVGGNDGGVVDATVGPDTGGEGGEGGAGNLDTGDIGGGGCACSTAGGSTGSAAGGLLLAAACFLRARRRRRK